MKISIYRWIDRIIGCILILLIWIVSLPFPKAKLEPKRILIVKLWAMGESILTLPLIHAIKKKYPKSRITVLCRDRVKAVYSGNKDISVVQSAEFLPILKLLFKPRQYDIAIDCEPYLNISALYSWLFAKRRIGFKHGIRKLLYTDKVVYDDQQHITLTYMDQGKPLGIEEIPQKLIPLAISRSDERRTDELLKEYGIKKSDKLICINTGAAESSKSRMWSAKNFAKVADALVKEFLVKIVLTGSKREIKDAEKVDKLMHYNAINIAGQTGEKELACILKRCILTISNDTGVVHLSAAMGTKTIGIFCPNTPVRWAPYGPGNEYVYKPVLPEPCVNTHKGQLPDCKGHRHMSNIKSDDVLQKARRILGR